MSTTRRAIGYRYGAALRMAADAHKGQTRKWTGRPYIYHPVRVATQAREYGMSDDAVLAALLHDTLEDTNLRPEAIQMALGSRVLELVEELTNPSKKHPNLRRAERKQMDREHLAKASQEARLLKLIDRTDNLREMSVEIGAEESFVRLYAEESMKLLYALLGTHPQAEAALGLVIAERLRGLGRKAA